MSLKSKLEAIIYAAEEPVTVEQIAVILHDSIVNDEGLAAENQDAAALKSEVRRRIRGAIEELTAEYASGERGMEIREIAGGYRMSTKPEHHDAVRAFAKSLKPPVKLSLPALETLAVIAYKQPVTVPEISEIRGVDCSGVIATLLDRKLITTAGRKAVVGRPILYKTSREFLMRFGLKDVGELPSLEEFEKLAAAEIQDELFATQPPAAGETSHHDMPEQQKNESEMTESEAHLGAVAEESDTGDVNVSDEAPEPPSEETVPGEVISETPGD